MNILAIHDGHNASACLLEDGKIKYCIQEERLIGEKNFHGYPEEAIKWILESVSPQKIDRIGLAGYSYRRPLDRTEKLSFYRDVGLTRRISANAKNVAQGVTQSLGIYESIKHKREKNRRVNGLNKFFSDSEIENKLVLVDHHLCHAATAYYGAPWDDERVLVLTLDGAGDGLCATVSIGERGKLTRIAETPEGHSIGNIYSRTTLVMGFVPKEHEYKLMGMAPYASKKGGKKAYDKFKQYLEVEGLSFRRKISEPTLYMVDRLRKDLSFLRFDWICWGLQHFTEELVVQWVRNVIAETGITKLALAGGVFMNVKLNKLIAELDEVEDVFIFPSCGDESLSIGAAFQIYHDMSGESIPGIREIYWGPDIDNGEVRSLLDRDGRFQYRHSNDIETEIADLLASGNIVARCRGKMEFGARALGNRSIFADPSDPTVVRTINKVIKQRDFWMPFAPMILAERQHDYLRNQKNIASPYMIMSFDTTERYHDLIAAVHNADLTARPQILEESFNQDCYRMMKRFEQDTGRGSLLNTSFNLHGYPIVKGPEEALWVLSNSDLEYLALGDYLVTKQ